jgi:hypothetical protein
MNNPDPLAPPLPMESDRQRITYLRERLDQMHLRMTELEAENEALMIRVEELESYVE